MNALSFNLNSFKDLFQKEKISKQCTKIHNILYNMVNNNSKFELNSKYYTPVSNDTPSTNGVLFIALVSFHQKTGSIIEYTYPNKNDILLNHSSFFDCLRSSSKLNNKIKNNEDVLNDIFNQLTVLCLPDGIHSVERDSEIFFIQNYSQLLYCTFTYYQVKTNIRNVIDEFQENTRDSIQKSLVIVSTHPYFKLYIDKASFCMHQFMMQNNLKNKQCFEMLYNDIINKKNSEMVINDIDAGITIYKKFVNFCKDDLIKLIKLLLLQKKIIVFSRVPNNATIFVLDLVSIIPGNILFNLNTNEQTNELKNYIQYLNKYNLPIKIFNDNYPLYPIFTLFDLDNLIKSNSKGFLLGTSNALMIDQHTIDCDCIINLDTCEIKYNNEELCDYINLNDNEIKLTENILDDFNIDNDLFSKDKELIGEWLISDYIIKNINNNDSTLINNIIKVNKVFLNKIHNYILNFIYDFGLLKTYLNDDLIIQQLNTYNTDINNITLFDQLIKDTNINIVHKIIHKYSYEFLLKFIETDIFKNWFTTINNPPEIYCLSEFSNKIENIKFTYINNDTFQGNLINGKKEGKGRYEYYNEKLIYIGEFKNDKKNGKGNLTSKDKVFLYDGSWSNDKYNGEGSLICKDIKYNGNFVKGKFQGNGSLIYQNGSVYNGTFKKGMKSGKGSIIFHNGNSYNGEFENDYINGKGIFKIKGETEEIKGTFKKGKLNGYVIDAEGNWIKSKEK